jgi:hypothetical protein
VDPFYDASEVEFLGYLVQARVDFVVVGGAAVQFYGYVRPRDDLDILWKPTEDNAACLRSAAARLGCYIDQDDAARMTATKTEFRLGHPYSFIHLLNEIGGVSFDAVKQHAQQAQIAFGFVPMISKDHLILSKSFRGDKKDRTDIQALTVE